MKQTNRELILKKSYDLTKDYTFLHEWFRNFCLNIEVPIIKAFIGTRTFVRHSINEPYNFNVFYSDIDLTVVIDRESETNVVLKKLNILKYIMPNIGEPEILLDNEYRNITDHETSLSVFVGQKIFQIRKLTWQYNKLSETSNPFERSKINRGIEKTLARLKTQTSHIPLANIFPNCPESKIRLTLQYPFFSGYLECWVEINKASHECSVICPNVEIADAFMQFIPGNNYEDTSLGYFELKKYLGFFEIGKSMSTIRTKQLDQITLAHGKAWIETLNRQINELNEAEQKLRL